MSPCSHHEAAHLLALTGVLALLTACDALANTDRLRPDQSTQPAAAGPSLFESEPVSAAQATIEKSLGASVKALELRAYADRWVLQAEDPDRPGRLYQLTYEKGRLGPPLEMTLRGSGKLDQNLFPLADVALDQIPTLVEQAPLGVDPEDGVVDYVLVRRGLPFERDVRVRVFVKSPRRDGYLEADRLGRPMER